MVETVKVTVEPETLTALTLIAPPEDLEMENADVAAVVAESASLYVRVSEVPDAETAADEKVGAVVSTATDIDEESFEAPLMVERTKIDLVPAVKVPVVQL